MVSDEDGTGTTDAPVAPCPECAQLTQRQVALSMLAGVVIGAGAFYLIRTYAK